jgi:hypothetical protein
MMSVALTLGVAAKLLPSARRLTLVITCAKLFQKVFSGFEETIPINPYRQAERGLMSEIFKHNKKCVSI